MNMSVEEALRLVVRHAGLQEVTESDLFGCEGLVLAEDVSSDVDSPPFDKAMMDGYAVRDEDLASGTAELKVIGELSAGSVPDRVVQAGTAYRIMTGAPLPKGADAVVMFERSQSIEGDRVLLDDSGYRPGQNVLSRGRELEAGQTVLRPGHVLRPAEIGLLAIVGHPRPKVYRRPRVAILSTGDEVVAPDSEPGPGQIRNSNDATMRNLAERAGAEVTSLGMARDEVDALSAKVAEGLEFDVLLTNGGVSAGTKDLVPSVFESLGVERVFHKVDFKPGKPLWFGKHAGGIVFGLPGNPVSVLVCFELFVRTALRARRGHPDSLPAPVTARLTREFAYPTRRVTYHPARLLFGNEGIEVDPVPWFGSPDLRALSEANALMVCPVTDAPHSAGAPMSVLPLYRDDV